MMLALVLAGLSLAFAAPPVLSGAWVNWQALRPVDAGQTTESRLVRCALPIAVYATAQRDLADLRVVEEAGAEVPFVIDTPIERHVEEWSDAVLSDTGFVPGRYTQAVADVGPSLTLHNVLEIRVAASDDDFFEWVAVDASDDGRTWRIVRERAPIFRFRSDGLEGQQRVTFPQTRSRWLRVRILDGRRQFYVSGIRVSQEFQTQVERTLLPATVTLNPQSPERKSWWDADLGVNDVPVSAVRFAATQPAFHRPVTVNSSDDGKSWTEVAQGDIYQDAGAAQMEVEVWGARGRYWRVTVFNRNDAPIQGLRVALRATPQYIVFRQEPGRSYILAYGNSRAQAPEYDFATLTKREQRDAATVVAAGPESKNAAYVSPEPWTERHAWVLWVALLAAVIIVGAIAIRSMR